MRRWQPGMRVVATHTITESGDEDDSLVHAVEGDLGIVEYVEADGTPTVRFERTGTATCVDDSEVDEV